MTGDVLDPCIQAEQHLQEYFDRMLPAELAGAIDTHLAACTSCAKAYAFEEHFRRYVKQCCAGGGSEDTCRAEFRAKLQKCRETA